MFLNFQKISQYKGDNQPIFKVDLLKDSFVNPTTNIPEERMRPPHDLTPDIIARMKTECFELSTLYKKITAEQMQMILAAQGPQRAAIVDRIFALPERDSQTPENDPSKVRIGGTDMYAVGRLESTPTGPELIMPDFNNMGNTSVPNIPTSLTPAQPSLSPASLAQPAAQLQPVNTGLAPQNLTPAPAALNADPSAMSDEEFRRTFGSF
jgi:hypothetical protein